MSSTDGQEARVVSSGYIPAKDDPDPDEIVEALREAVFENPQLREMPAEEVARQLVLDSSIQGSWSVTVGKIKVGASIRNPDP
jgi:hypothetical protein